MSIYELDASGFQTTGERAGLRWALAACDAVHGVFLTSREDTLAVLFAGDRDAFSAWSRTLAAAHPTNPEPKELFR